MEIFYLYSVKENVNTSKLLYYFTDHVTDSTTSTSYLPSRISDGRRTHSTSDCVTKTRTHGPGSRYRTEMVEQRFTCIRSNSGSQS